MLRRAHYVRGALRLCLGLPESYRARCRPELVRGYVRTITCRVGCRIIAVEMSQLPGAETAVGSASTTIGQVCLGQCLKVGVALIFVAQSRVWERPRDSEFGFVPHETGLGRGSVESRVEGHHFGIVSKGLKSVRAARREE